MDGDGVELVDRACVYVCGAWPGPPRPLRVVF